MVSKEEQKFVDIEQKHLFEKINLNHNLNSLPKHQSSSNNLRNHRIETFDDITSIQADSVATASIS